MFLLRDKLITQGEKWETSTKTCNETMLRDKLRVFVSRISPPLLRTQIHMPRHASSACVKEARKGFSLHARAQSTHAITKMHASAESVLKSAYRKLMMRKIARTGNKICRKHLFLARKFAR